MRQTLDTRFARAAKAKAPRDLADARHRSLLRARSALSALLRGRSPPADTGRGLTGALEFGDAAAVELAGIPDTPDLRGSDEAMLARDLAVEYPWCLRITTLRRDLAAELLQEQQSEIFDSN